MVRALSEDLRGRVIEAVEAEASHQEAAARFGVSVSSAIRWVAAWRANASRRDGWRSEGRVIEAHRAFLLVQVKAKPDVTLAELRALLWRRGASVVELPSPMATGRPPHWSRVSASAA